MLEAFANLAPPWPDSLFLLRQSELRIEDRYADWPVGHSDITRFLLQCYGVHSHSVRTFRGFCSSLSGCHQAVPCSRQEHFKARIAV